MTELPAWRDVAVPRDDIQDGSFDESSFAADLGLAAAGQGRPEYRDAWLFFEQTYLTRNLAVVLDELIRRVDGDPAAAGVYRMQTEFGGGKTHTLLSAYHLFKSPVEVIETACGTDLAARTKRSSFPSAPCRLSRPRSRPATVRCFWRASARRRRPRQGARRSCSRGQRSRDTAAPARRGGVCPPVSLGPMRW